MTPVHAVYWTTKHRVSVHRLKMFVASYESSGDEEAVAHAMSAAAHQGTATTNDLVKPVNAIAQAVTAPEGEAKHFIRLNSCPDSENAGPKGHRTA